MKGIKIFILLLLVSSCSTLSNLENFSKSDPVPKIDSFSIKELKLDF